MKSTQLSWNELNPINYIYKPNSAMKWIMKRCKK